MKDLIEKLSNLRGISGYEYRISDEIAKLFMPLADEVSVDEMGNVIAVKRCGKPDAKKVMIEAHCDEIGLMVSQIDEKGFLKFVNIGGVDPRTLPGAEVTVHAKEDLYGVIGAKPPHLQKGDDPNKSSQIPDMAIDLGMSRERVLELVSVGDSITLPQSVGALGASQFSGKTLDDRAGVAALLETLRRLQKCRLEVDVYAVAAVQEEVGLRGAKTATYRIMPELAIAIDVCHGITPDNSDNAFEVGCGAVMSVGPNIHPKLQKRLAETAQKYHIKTEIEVDGGDTGTDAWVMQTSGNGVPTALLSIPLKYMHTSVETLDLKDAEAVSELLSFFIQDLEDDLEGWLCF